MKKDKRTPAIVRVGDLVRIRKINPGDAWYMKRDLFLDRVGEVVWARYFQDAFACVLEMDNETHIFADIEVEKL